MPYVIEQCILLQVLGFKLTTVFCIALLAGPFWVNGGSNIVYFIFIKALMGKLPLQLNSLLSINNMTHETRSHDWIRLSVPQYRTAWRGCLQYCCSHYVEQVSSLFLWYHTVYSQRASGWIAKGKYLQLLKLYAYVLSYGHGCKCVHECVCKFV